MQVTIEDVQAQRGSTAQFQAVIEGNPQPTVTWYKVRTVCEIPTRHGMALTESAVDCGARSLG